MSEGVTRRGFLQIAGGSLTGLVIGMSPFSVLADEKTEKPGPVVALENLYTAAREGNRVKALSYFSDNEHNQQLKILLESRDDWARHYFGEGMCSDPKVEELTQDVAQVALTTTRTYNDKQYPIGLRYHMRRIAVEYEVKWIIDKDEIVPIN